MSDKKRYFLYVFFAFVSMAINIGTQIFVSLVVDLSKTNFFQYVLTGNITVKLIVSMAIATIVAFIFKFIVDKIFIFKNINKKMKENLRQIFFYGLFAVITTLIFWGFELCFKYVFVFSYSEYLGGFVGLCIGYSLKFILDSRFVFAQPS
jgi:putative flippase GtrA